jgi:uncharacterized protein (DUF697 family)
METLMNEPAIPAVAESRFGRTWRNVRDWFRGKHANKAVDLDKVRAKTPAPVLWLFGKTQSGKTSVVRYLTGADDAEIGNGFRPCTRTSRMYPFPTPDAPVFTFLDTRGVDEPGYDPAEDIAAFDSQAHLILVTCRITDFATRNVKDALTKIRAANPRRPVLLVLTCLHEAYPQKQHPQPYPYAQTIPPDVREGEPLDTVRKLVANQQEQFAGLVDVIVPVDLTDPAEGYDDPTYGGEALKAAILQLLPTAYRETLRHFVEANEQFRDRQSRRAAPVLVGYSSLAATAGALPVPFVDLLTLPAIQARMIHALAEQSGNKQSGTRFIELSASAGVGLLASMGLRQVAKLIPYVGSVVGASLAGASTYALGRAFLEYDRRVHDGHLPDKTEVAELYREHLAAAERGWRKAK